MPPRARKTAATKPVVEPQLVEDEADQAPEVGPEAAAGPDIEDTAVAEPVQEILAPEPETETEVQVAAGPVSHWELVGLPGIEDFPCRSCLPAGPGDNVGSIGCQHGQWVRVWDGS